MSAQFELLSVAFRIVPDVGQGGHRVEEPPMADLHKIPDIPVSVATSGK